MNTPLITIGITCYKAEYSIEKSIISAIEQAWDNTEIIVVDDYSCDGTINRLKQLQNTFSFLHIIYQDTNKGVAASRNEIISLAKGEFTCFIDDDDTSASDRLQKQYERIISYEKQFANGYPVICHTARTQVYPDGLNRYEPTMGATEGIAPNGHTVIDRILTGRPASNTFGSIATCSQMARTSIYRELNGFDESFKRCEDTDLNIRAALLGAHFIGLNEPLVTQSMTLATDKKLFEENKYWIQLLTKHKIFIDTNFSYSFCCRWLNAKHDFLQGKKFIFGLKIVGLLIRHPVLTLKRVIWARPNTSFNLTLKKFHEKKL